MLKRAVCALMVVLTFCLSGCVTPTSGLVPFVDSKDGYRFLYPNGWLETKLKDGPDVLFHDIIEPSEIVSVVISKLESVKNLQDIGDAKDVGLRLQKRVIAAPGSGREAELLSAEQRDQNGRPYYLLEYAVKRTNGEFRHDLVSVSANRGNLYTLSVSSLESRWTKVKDLFYRVASSFLVE
ncbi:photosystem II reaction center PsbP [Tumidithrix helvetica PCC 7403]|uniref:photosystem II reaction center PsbP n=1 Tax=Tumidithrix helvetica TaxID=3457545 RepID=UPI003C9C3003